MKTTRLITLIAAVLVLAGCYKCPPEGDRTIAYTVDNSAEKRVVLNGMAEWQQLLDRFCGWAQDGSTVTFYNTNRAAKAMATKAKVEYSTTDREAMKRWMAEMEEAGKTVTVSYDSQTGTWYGTAYATAPQPPMPSGGLITYEYDGMNDFGYIWSFDTVNHRVYITLHYTIQNITAPDYPVGVYEYRHADEVNTPFAYWLIDSWGDTAGLYILNYIGSDTLHFNSTHLGNPVTLVRTDRWHTYLCSNLGLNIAMHVCGNIIEVYPEVYIGQMDVNGMERIDFVWPFEFGRFEMWRSEMTQPAMGTPYWSLTLDYWPFGGTAVIDDVIIQGEPLGDNQFTISKGCQFVFHRL